MNRVAVVGGGASGMFAAAAAARSGCQVDLFEKNEKLGKKLYITGKGRCNLTNDCEMEELLEAVCSNRKFLYSAFYGFTNRDAIRFFEEAGMPVKTERGNRVFPVSDHASDVIGALAGEMKKSGVKVHLNREVEGLLLAGGKEGELPGAAGLRLKDGTSFCADRVIVATGGLSYPSTGSTGDGYRFAREAGHSVTELSPSLVPLTVQEEDAAAMQGLSLKNVEVTVSRGKKQLFRDFGEMMFTHFGVTGPLILSASSRIQKELKKGPLDMKIDLKPALERERLDGRILRDFEENKNRQFKNALGALLPAKMIPVIIRRSGIDPQKAVHDISRQERQKLTDAIKSFGLTLTGLRGYREAVITRGGISVKEVNPSTMESRLVRGLYFAGEVLDVDAVTGGFNLQIAWSTGYAAGCAAAKSENEE